MSNTLLNAQIGSQSIGSPQGQKMKKELKTTNATVLNIRKLNQWHIKRMPYYGQMRFIIGM